MGNIKRFAMLAAFLPVLFLDGCGSEDGGSTTTPSPSGKTPSGTPKSPSATTTPAPVAATPAPTAILGVASTEMDNDWTGVTTVQVVLDNTATTLQRDVPVTIKAGLSAKAIELTYTGTAPSNAGSAIISDKLTQTDSSKDTWQIDLKAIPDNVVGVTVIIPTGMVTLGNIAAVLVKGASSSSYGAHVTVDSLVTDAPGPAIITKVSANKKNTIKVPAVTSSAGGSTVTASDSAQITVQRLVQSTNDADSITLQSDLVASSDTPKVTLNNWDTTGDFDKYTGNIILVVTASNAPDSALNMIEIEATKDTIAGHNTDSTITCAGAQPTARVNFLETSPAWDVSEIKSSFSGTANGGPTCVTIGAGTPEDFSPRLLDERLQAGDQDF